MTHLVFVSVAKRLDAGTYSPCIARAVRMPIAAPRRHVTGLSRSPWAAVLPYVGSGVLGGLVGCLLAGGLP